MDPHAVTAATSEEHQLAGASPPPQQVQPVAANTNDQATATEVVTEVATEVPTTITTATTATNLRQHGTRSSNKRSRGSAGSSNRNVMSPTPSESSLPSAGGASAAPNAAAAAAAAALTAATGVVLSQTTNSLGLQGLYSLLFTNTTTSLPTLEQVQQAASKALQESPPHVHLSKSDAAPQLKIVDSNESRCLVRGGFRGYRMVRASHGVSSAGFYYYEAVILPPPSVQEIAASLPPNARLGRKLQEQMQQALQYNAEQQEQPSETTAAATVGQFENNKSNNDGATADAEGNSRIKRRRKTLPSVTGIDEAPPLFGGHVRLGFSLRSGDLQAPVGYDKWSYAVRDTMGSKIHQSRREDRWGGVPFGPGDVVGFAIYLNGGKTDDKAGTTSTVTAQSSSDQTNHIRFFKNGEPMGHFIIAKGKRQGGAAFDNIPDGTYYPAISCYMGGTVRVNFGPNFIYPPRKLPSGMMKQFKPFSDLCPPPLEPDEVVRRGLKELKTNSIWRSKPEMLAAFKEAVELEAQLRFDAYRKHMNRHVQDVRAARQERNLSTTELIDPFGPDATTPATIKSCNPST